MVGALLGAVGASLLAGLQFSASNEDEAWLAAVDAREQLALYRLEEGRLLAAERGASLRVAAAAGDDRLMREARERYDRHRGAGAMGGFDPALIRRALDAGDGMPLQWFAAYASAVADAHAVVHRALRDSAVGDVAEVEAVDARLQALEHQAQIRGLGHAALAAHSLGPGTWREMVRHHEAARGLDALAAAADGEVAPPPPFAALLDAARPPATPGAVAANAWWKAWTPFIDARYATVATRLHAMFAAARTAHRLSQRRHLRLSGFWGLAGLGLLVALLLALRRDPSPPVRPA